MYVLVDNVFFYMTCLWFQCSHRECVTCHSSVTVEVGLILCQNVCHLSANALFQGTNNLQHILPDIDSSSVVLAFQITYHCRRFLVSVCMHTCSAISRSNIVPSSHRLSRTLPRRSVPPALRENNQTSTTLCDLIPIIRFLLDIPF